MIELTKNTDKTLSVLYLIESAGRGGAETIVVALARARGDRACVGSLRSGWMWEQLAAAQVPVLGLSYRRSDLLLAIRIARLIAHVDPDIVHCNCFTMNTAGAIGAALAGVPSIGTMHGAIYDLDTKARRLAYRIAGAQHRRMVTVSEYLRGELNRRAKVPMRKIDMIYNGVATPTIGRESGPAIRRELGLTESNFVVGSVGMFRPEKGHIDLIDAVAQARQRVPGLRLFLMGDGKQKAEIQKRCREMAMDDAVRFVLPGSNVASFLTALDLFALPSHTEGLSIATIEAMSCGTPVVVTDCGGPTEIVTDGVTGLVVPPCDSQAMADALVRLAEDSTLRVCLGANGRARALDSFSLSSMLTRYDRLYEEVCR